MISMDIGSLFGVEFHIPTFILIIFGLLLAFYILYTWDFDTFDKMGIPSIKHRIPYGHLGPIMRDGMHKTIRNIYQQGKKSKLIGLFEPTPVLVITDLDMMNEIAVKQFDSFRNIPSFFAGFPSDRFLNFTKDDHWKHMRTLLSPTFSAKKLKEMVGSINGSSNELVGKLHESSQSGEGLKLHETIPMFTLDTIARTSFGLNISVMKNPQSEFVKETNKFVDYFSLKNPMFILVVFVPAIRRVLEFFNIQIVSRSAGDFFKKIIEETEQKRKEQGIVQADFLQHLVNLRVNPDAEKRAKQGDLQNGDFKIGDSGLWSTKGLVDDDILGSVLVFFIAGLDTVANGLAAVLYCLATNSECQEKLVEEIEATIGDKEVVEYDDVVGNMSYLEGCIHESLRMYPITPRLDRYCTEECVVGGIRIPKGMKVCLPVSGVHYDKEIWPNPDVFNPERFNRNAKSQRHQYAYQPFGHGPRNCIGMRLALLEIKIAVVKILQKFEVVRTSKTQVPLPMKSFGVLEEAGMDINIIGRKLNS